MSEQIPINERLKAYRNALGLTQQEVADALNLNRSTYTYYETSRSEPSLTTLGKLSVIFGVPLHSILGSEPPAPLIRDNPDANNYPQDMNSDESMSFSSLSKEEKKLVINFRMLSKKQQKEILASFGISSDAKKTSNSSN